MSCAEDKKVAVWDYRNRKVEKTIQKGDYFKSLDYINSLRILIGGNMDKTVYSFQIGEYLDKKTWLQDRPAEKKKEGTLPEDKASPRPPQEQEEKDKEPESESPAEEKVEEEKEEKEEEEEKTFMLEDKEKKTEEEIVTLLKDMKKLLND